MDYFTAVDDLISGGQSDDSGAGMIGDIEYNSCCYYFYASLDTDKLRSNLEGTENADEIAGAALPAVVEAMAYTNPSGKQNTFAGHVLPEVITIESKQKKVPVSYVNAFAVPAKAHGGMSVAQDSVQKLIEEIDLVDSKFGLPVNHRLWFTMRGESQPKNAENCVSFGELLDRLSTIEAEED